MSSSEGHRVAVYYQTQYDRTLPSNSPFGHYVSPLPLISLITHLIVAAFHINPGRSGGFITLNDNGPDEDFFAQMWQDIGDMQSQGVKVLGMLGGAAQGSYADLSTDAGFEMYYPALADVIKKHHLDGIDLDVEESESLASITKLISKLKADFGPQFIITLAPVSSALLDESNLSGFSYTALERQAGANISWYNAQFYSGFGTFFPDNQYIDIATYDGFSSNPENGNVGLDPMRLVATSLTSPDDGFGYIDPSNVVKSVQDLAARYGQRFGGVAGWEYFNSEPGYSQGKPQEWAEMMKEAMGTIQGKYQAAKKVIVKPPAKHH